MWPKIIMSDNNKDELEQLWQQITNAHFQDLEFEFTFWILVVSGSKLFKTLGKQRKIRLPRRPRTGPPPRVTFRGYSYDIRYGYKIGYFPEENSCHLICVLY